MTGKVVEFHWQNPHVYIHLEAAGKDGKVREWTIDARIRASSIASAGNST